MADFMKKILLDELKKLRNDPTRMTRMVRKQLKVEACTCPNLENGKAVVKLNPKDYEMMRRELEEMNFLTDKVLAAWDNISVDDLVTEVSKVAVVANTMDLGFKITGFLNFWRENGFPTTVAHVADKFKLKKLEEVKEKSVLLSDCHKVSGNLDEIEAVLTRQGLLRKGKVGDNGEKNGKSERDLKGMKGSEDKGGNGNGNGNGHDGNGNGYGISGSFFNDFDPW